MPNFSGLDRLKWVLRSLQSWLSFFTLLYGLSWIRRSVEETVYQIKGVWPFKNLI